MRMEAVLGVPLNAQAKALLLLRRFSPHTHFFTFLPTKHHLCTTPSLPSPSISKTHQIKPPSAPSRHFQTTFSPFPFPPLMKAHLYTSFFCTLIHLYLAAGRFLNASDAFYAMRNHGFVPVLPLWNRLLYQFNACGLVSQVRLLYYDMLSCGIVPNVFTHNIMVHSLCKVGELVPALDFLRQVEIDTVTYNTVIWGFCKKGLAFQGLGLLSEMVKRGIPIDSYTCNTLVKGFCQIGFVDHGSRVFEDLMKGGIHGDVVGLNTLIDGYCKVGHISHALKLMEDVREGEFPDTVSYNSLINGFCKMGDFEKAKCLFDEILRLQKEEACADLDADDVE
uniref:Pentatricopeptide repeat-containing protein n=1 Tax=Cannabis sativa TaxID=3483 RepID=A0A803Q2N3_CANSA